MDGWYFIWLTAKQLQSMQKQKTNPPECDTLALEICSRDFTNPCRFWMNTSALGGSHEKRLLPDK